MFSKRHYYQYMPTYCKTSDKLLNALVQKRRNIIICDDLYHSYLKYAKNSVAAKKKKTFCKIALGVSFFTLPILSGWIALSSGVITLNLGNKNDCLPKYKIYIDEYTQQIALLR